MVAGLATPEGVALDASPEAVKRYQKPTLLVVQVGAARLLRIDIATGARIEEIAAGLPIRASGALPTLLDYTADVLVRSDGTIVVTGTAEGSLIEISKQ